MIINKMSLFLIIGHSHDTLSVSFKYCSKKNIGMAKLMYKPIKKQPEDDFYYF